MNSRRSYVTNHHSFPRIQDMYHSQRPLRSVDIDALLQPPSYSIGDVNEVLPILETKGLLSQPVSL